jgi:hypothetical protein
MICTLLLLLLPQAEEGGLKAGEHFRLATESEARPATLEHRHFSQTGASFGRIIDAFTRQPIEGASVETWTEELNAYAAGHELIGSMVTTKDGCFLLTRGGKGRVSAPGYATSTDIAIDQGSVVELFPIDPRAAPPRIRFIDTAGRPIPDVRVTSTLTCSHDVPALDVRSDQAGRVVLPHYGLQNWIPELRIRADGFRGIEYLSGEEVLVNSRESGEQLIVLPRRLAAIDLQILDLQGEPLADTAMHFVDGECYHILRSDERGLLRIESRYDGSGIYPIGFGLPREAGVLPNVDLVPPTRVALRMSGEDWVELQPDLPLGELRVEAPLDWLISDAAGNLEALLVHQDGWFANLSPKDLSSGLQFPSGRAQLFLGGENSSLESVQIEITISENKTTTVDLASLTKQRKAIQLVRPEGVWIDWIEHAGETISPGRRLELLFVSPDEPVQIQWRTDDAAYRRTIVASELARIDVLDLNELKNAMLIESASSRKRETRAVEIILPSIANPMHCSTTLGLDVEGEAEIHELALDEEGALKFQLTAPEGADVLASFQVEGFRTHWLRMLMPPSASFDAAPIQLHPIAEASLQLVSEQPIQFLGGVEPDWFNELDPGPLGLTFSTGEGPMYRLELIIEAGAHRVVDLDQLLAKLESESKD